MSELALTEKNLRRPLHRRQKNDKLQELRPKFNKEFGLTV